MSRVSRDSTPAPVHPAGRWRRRLAVLLVSISSLHAAPLHIEFHHEVDGRPLLVDSLRYENSRGETFSATRLDWLATDFSVTTAGGEILDFPGTVAYIPTDGTTFTLPDLPAEKITAITFHVGPDEETNHSDPARYTASNPLNPNFNNLHWDWQGGYIFLALEGHWRAPDEKLPGGYAYHFANDPQRTTITLPVDVDLRNETRVAVALDPQKLLAGLSFAEDGATTHSREGDPVAAQLKSNLPSAFRVTDFQEGGIPSPPNPPKPIDLPADPQPYPITLPRHIPLPPLVSEKRVGWVESGATRLPTIKMAKQPVATGCFAAPARLAVPCTCAKTECALVAEPAGVFLV